MTDPTRCTRPLRSTGLRTALRTSLRTVLALVLFSALGAPSPGNVGGCGGAPAVADAQTHCQEKNYWSCYRELAAGRMTEAEFEVCDAPTAVVCQGASWPAGCVPAQGQSEACIALLRDAALLNNSTEELFQMYSDCDLCL